MPETKTTVTLELTSTHTDDLQDLYDWLEAILRKAQGRPNTPDPHWIMLMESRLRTVAYILEADNKARGVN